MNEIKINLDNLNEDEREQLMMLVEKGNKPKSKVWEPSISDCGWLICGGGDIAKGCISSDSKSYYEMGNCFPTKEEAEEEATRRKMLTRWKRLSIEAGEEDNPWDGVHWHCDCYYSVIDDRINVAHNSTMHSEGVYFPSAASLKAAIAKLGEENVKRYILGVND